MAQINAADYGAMRRNLFRLGKGKEEMKARAGGMVSEPQLLAIFQAVEDGVVGAFIGPLPALTIKASIESIWGASITGAFLTKIRDAWVARRFEVG